MRNIFVKEVEKMMEYNKEIVFLTAESGFSVVESLQAKYPDRFYNLGIAEQSLVTTATGVALRGLKPIAYTMAMFLSMRAYEQIRVDVTYQNIPVILAGIIPGLGYGNAGPTHHSIEDAAILRVLPNMTVMYPSCEIDVIAATHQIIDYGKPCYIGLGRNPANYKANYDESAFTIGKAIRIRDGKDVAIITYGSVLPNVVKAAELLETQGIIARIINMHTIKPLDTKCIEEAINDCGVIITAEEESIIGGLGGAVAEFLAELDNKDYRFKRLGIPDTYGETTGSHTYMQRLYHIDAEGIANSVRSFLHE